MSSRSLSLNMSALYFGIADCRLFWNERKLVFFQQMNLLARVHDLHAEAVFIQRDAFDLLFRRR